MMICLGLGEHRRALSWFSKGVSVRAPWVIDLGALPLFDPLRAHPQVKRELLGVGLRGS